MRELSFWLSINKILEVSKNIYPKALKIIIIHIGKGGADEGIEESPTPDGLDRPGLNYTLATP